MAGFNANNKSNCFNHVPKDFPDDLKVSAKIYDYGGYFECVWNWKKR